MKKLDAVGKQCPIPVIMAKKEVEQGTKEFEISVDNSYSVENLKKFAENSKCSVSVSEENGVFTLQITATAETNCDNVNVECNIPSALKNWAVFVGKDVIGDGEKELGTNLIRMFFYTLSQEADVPKYILFMNSGVNLPALDSQVIEHLTALESKGTEILICGTCLNYYKIADTPKVGKVSNMYDIVSKMKAADKVITL